MISYLFPPAAETSGLVVAKRIRDWGRPVDLIASEPPRGRTPDQGALAVAGDTLREMVQIRGDHQGLTDWARVEEFTRHGLERIQALEKKSGRYRSVYSRSMMPASHVLAAAYKLSHPKTPWSAEFSDPLVLDTRGQRRRGVATGPAADRLRAALQERGVAAPDAGEMFELVETLVYALADEIVFTNDNQRQLMLKGITDPKLRERARELSAVAPHPEPARELYSASHVDAAFDPDVINVGYFGVFYGIRTAAALLEPWTRLERAERAQLRLHLYVPKPKAVRLQVLELGLEDCVQVHRFVPYLDFLSIATQLDWLVVADAEASEVFGVNPYVPSKLADYRGSGTPVWAMVEPGSPMSKIEGLTTTRLGDDAAAAEHLRGLISEHRGARQSKLKS